MIHILIIVAGLVLLFLGSNALIKGTVALARRFKLSNLLVSMVVVGCGTSIPEMTVSVGAAFKGSSDIAVGNVVGSNIVNILLILGLIAIFLPISIDRKSVKNDTLIMLATSILLCGLTFTRVINFLSGTMMLLAFIAYIVGSYRKNKKTDKKAVQHIKENTEGVTQLSIVKIIFFSLIGLGLLISGAYLLIEGAVAIARNFGISEAIIGLTIVATGTSLPELATSIIAAYHKHTDIIIGNIVGSNIFNILAILGITAMVSPISIAKQIAHFDVWIMLGASLFFSIYLLKGFKIGKISGLIMFGAYIFYVIILL